VKIVILTGLFPPKWLGGTEIASYYIAKYLAVKGHEVHVITRRDPGLPRNEYVEGFYIHRIGIPRMGTLILKVGGLTLFTLDLCILLKKMQPHIIHAQGILMGLPCLICKKLLKIPFVVMSQGSDVYGYWFYKSLISRLVLKNADAVIALTEDMKKQMLKIHSREISIIPNGVEIETFSAITREEARRTLGIDAHEKILLYVGRLHPAKGVRYLVKAMDIIKNYYGDNVKLIIVGDGEQRDYLLRLTRKLNLENYIIFVGEVPHRNIPIYLKAADVLILPSLREGFPLIILEAMTAGLPIIATRVGGVPEIIKDYENGFVVGPMSPHQIAEKCLLLLKDEKLRKKISKNNIEKAKEFSWEKVTQNLERLYLTLLKRY